MCFGPVKDSRLTVPAYALGIFFFEGFCDVKKGGHHPETNLANYGYMANNESREKPGSFYILAYRLELIVEIW
jgi:hypothetical protein